MVSQWVIKCFMQNGQIFYWNKSDFKPKLENAKFFKRKGDAEKQAKICKEFDKVQRDLIEQSRGKGAADCLFNQGVKEYKPVEVQFIEIDN